MKFLKPFTIFLIINFGALGIGSLLMADGPQGDWYQGLEKAPWTPDGWVFGAAWTSIMICFSVYMTFLYLEKPAIKVLELFAIQFICNVSWNFFFFNQKLVDIGLIIIVLLTIIIAAFLFTYYKKMKLKSILILPYLIWLCVAISLNLYVVLYN